MNIKLLKMGFPSFSQNYMYFRDGKRVVLKFLHLPNLPSILIALCLPQDISCENKLLQVVQLVLNIDVWQNYDVSLSWYISLQTNLRTTSQLLV